MNKTALKNFAIWARMELIRRVTDRANEYGITEALCKKNAVKPSAEFVKPEGGLLTREEVALRDALLREIQEKGFTQVMEEAAYTWFNRFIALKYLEVHGLSPLDESVLPDANSKPPKILSVAQRVDLPGVDRGEVLKMLEANETEALYRHLVIALCNALSASLPLMFEPIQDYTELLFPRGLLRSDSVLSEMARRVESEDWQQIEIIGWLYQYYNTELKAETFALLKKNVKITKERIGAATQLFTPKWIVRYMVENSLGRIWIERERARTGRDEKELVAPYGWKYYLPEAEQEPEVAVKLQDIRAARKNLSPEDIRLIDPCMGSGHILACAFDVLIQLYRASGYTDRDAVRNIVEKNLFGLDIDDRAAQLAYFTIMMKACEYDPRFLSRGLQPNVCAIQESNSLEAFDRLSGQMDLGMTDVNLANALIDTFRDAKEYGSILDVSISNLDALPGLMERLEAACLSSLELQKWFENAKTLLPVLAQQARIMAQKYDAVTTNPPYMGSSSMNAILSEYVKAAYPDSKSDLFAVFIDRCGEMLKQHGYQAMITQYVWMYKTGYTDFRKRMLCRQMVNMTHLGPGAFNEINGEIVNTISFVMSINAISGYRSVFKRLLEYQDEVAKREGFLSNSKIYCTKQERFFFVAEFIYAYWISERVFKLLYDIPSLESVSYPRKGLTTGDNNRFVRLWHEVCFTTISFKFKRKWFPMTKGGLFRKWYGNNEYVVNWENEGYEIRHFADDNGKLRSVPRNMQYYLHECISWNDTGSSDLAFRYQEDYFIPNASGPCVYSGQVGIHYLIGLLNSKVSRSFMEVLAPALKFEVGQVAKFPVIYSTDNQISIESINKECVSLSRADWDSFETSWDFQRHPLLGFRDFEDIQEGMPMRPNCTIASKYNNWKAICNNRFEKLKGNEEELNRIFVDIYGLQDELTPEVEDKDVTVYRIIDEPNEEERSMRYVLSKRDAITTFMSYAVGCMMGRYSPYVGGLVLAGQPYEEGFHHNAVLRQGLEGEWVEEPGEGVVIVSAKGEKAKAPEGAFLPDRDAIIPITDDEYFQDDIVTKFIRFVEAIYGSETLEENLRFIADALGTRGDTPREAIRNYYLKEFYKDHLKTYQRRPIYWLFDSGKADGFKALVYLHRYDRDTLARIRTDYVHEQQERLRTQLNIAKKSMEDADPRRRAAATKRAQKLSKQLEELNRYEELLHHMADMRIALDLDDGVVVNYAKMGELVAKI